MVRVIYLRLGIEFGSIYWEFFSFFRGDVEMQNRNFVSGLGSFSYKLGFSGP